MRTTVPLLLLGLALAAGSAITLGVFDDPSSNPDLAARPDGAEDSRGPRLLGCTGRGASNESPPPHTDVKTQEEDARRRPIATVEGRILDVRGIPVSGVPVFVRKTLWRFGPPDEEASVGDATSDADGHYRLSLQDPGDFTIFAFGAGWISRELPDVDTRESYNPLLLSVVPGAALHHDLTVVAGGKVHGVVRDLEGTPLPGVRVRMNEEGYQIGFCGNAPLEYDFAFVPPPPTVLTDASGRYAFPSVLPGVDLGVWASLEGYEPASASTRVRAGEASAIDLVLAPATPQPTWTLRVHVLEDESEYPIAGAHVNGNPTDAAGWAALEGIWRKTCWVRLSAEGRFDNAVQVEAPADVASGSAQVSVECRLRRAAAIGGVVRLPDGRPAKGAVVTLGKGMAPAHDGRDAYPDAEGRFGFFPVDPEDDAAPLRVTLFRDARHYEAEITANPDDTSLEIQLVETAHDPALDPREVRVTGPDGEPILSAKAVLHAQHRARSTLKDGVLRLEPVDVPFWIEIHTATDAGGTRPGAALFGPFDTTQDVDDTLQLPKGGRIEGRTLDADGAPIPGLRVILRAPHVALAKTGGGNAEHGRIHTDRAGRFVFEGLGTCDYVLRVSTPKRWVTPPPLEVRANAPPVEIRLEATTHTTIQVVDEQGHPVGGCTVEAYVGNAIPFYTSRGGMKGETYADGRVTLHGLQEDRRYTLAVSPPYDRKDLLATSLERWSPTGGTQVVLPTAATLAGRVVDPTGRPLRGAWIQFLFANDRRGSGTSTDEEGHFRFEGLKPGPVRLLVRQGPFGPASEHAARVPRVDLRIVHDPGARVVVRPLNAPADGTPFEWRLAGGAKDAKPKTLAGQGVWDGALTLEGLNPGDHYALWLFVPRDDMVLYLPDLGGDAGQVRPRLVPALKVQGQLILADGKTLPEGGRVAVQGKALVRTASAGRDGRFVVKGLPSGTWWIEASAWRNLDEYGATREEVRAGTTVTVRLVHEDD